MKTLNQHIGDLNKQLRNFSVDKIPSKCLFPNCKESAIYSHSIQENGILDLLEDDIEKEGRKIYSIDDYPDIDFQAKHLSSFLRSKRKLRSFGKNDSSGLFMFCSKHDKEIFIEIEDTEFKGSQRQFFLHSIRAYLYDIRKAELCYSFMKDKVSGIKELTIPADMINNLIKVKDEMLEFIPDTHIITEIEACSLKSIKENSILKALDLKNEQKDFENLNFVGKSGAEVKAIFGKYIQVLNDVPNFTVLSETLSKRIELLKTDSRLSFASFMNLVLTEAINSFEYKTWAFNMKIPIAGSFIVRGKNQNETFSKDIEDYTPLFSFTIFPNKKTKETIVILSSLLKNESKVFFSRLNTLTDYELQFALSNIIIIHGTNTFISPRMWNKFSEKEKDYFINKKMEKGAFVLEKIDYSLNLFSEKYRE